MGAVPATAPAAKPKTLKVCAPVAVARTKAGMARTLLRGEIVTGDLDPASVSHLLGLGLVKEG